PATPTCRQTSSRRSKPTPTTPGTTTAAPTVCSSSPHRREPVTNSSIKEPCSRSTRCSPGTQATTRSCHNSEDNETSLRLARPGDEMTGLYAHAQTTWECPRNCVGMSELEPHAFNDYTERAGSRASEGS